MGIKKNQIQSTTDTEIKPSEHELQSSCIEWFRKQYPRLLLHLFAIPNARKCDYRTANYLKKEGVTSGVADCFLAVPSDGLHGVFIEFKVGNNKQQQEQKDFEISMLGKDYGYWLIRDFNNFMDAINNYLR